MRHFRSGPEILGEQTDAEFFELHGEVFLKFLLTMYYFAVGCLASAGW